MTNYQISQQFWKRNMICLPIVLAFVFLSMIPHCHFLFFVALAALAYQVYCLVQQIRFGRKADREWRDL